jgi:hypothetical protein
MKQKSTLTVDGQKFTVGNYAEASRHYCAKREASGLGASQFGPATIQDGKKPIAHISYNGKVWSGRPADWVSNKIPLFDPFAKKPNRLDRVLFGQ